MVELWCVTKGLHVLFLCITALTYQLVCQILNKDNLNLKQKKLKFSWNIQEITGNMFILSRTFLENILKIFWKFRKFTCSNWFFFQEISLSDRMYSSARITGHRNFLRFFCCVFVWCPLKCFCLYVVGAKSSWSARCKGGKTRNVPGRLGWKKTKLQGAGGGIRDRGNI